jgi:hypothetical protein
VCAGRAPGHPGEVRVVEGPLSVHLSAPEVSMNAQGVSRHLLITHVCHPCAGVTLMTPWALLVLMLLQSSWTPRQQGSLCR